MSAPKPWREVDSAASPQIRELLQHAHGSKPMSAAMRSKLTVGVGKLATLPVSMGVAVVSTKAVIEVGVVLAATSVGVGFVQTYSARHHSAHHAAVQVPMRAQQRNPSDIVVLPVMQIEDPISPATASSSPPATAPRADPPSTPSRASNNRRIVGRTPTAVAMRPAAPMVHRAPSAGPLPPPVPEDVFLDGARSVLLSNPRDALARIDAYRHAYPAGQFVDMSEVIAIDALHRLGETGTRRNGARCF